MEAIIRAILENLLIKAETQSLPYLVGGKSKHKSMAINSYNLYGTGNGVYKLNFLLAGLAMAQV